MTATASLEIWHAFVVDGQHVKKLVGFLHQPIGDVEIEATCVDGIERHFPDAKRLLAYENALSCAIRELRISARSDDGSKAATLVFSDSEFRSVWADLSGTELVVQRLRDDIVTVIEGTRPWYARFARLDFFPVMFVALFALWVVLNLAVALNIATSFGWLATSGAEMTKETAALHRVYSVLLVLAAVAVGYILNRVRKRLFPIGTFAIGQAKERYEFLEKIRWAVCISFLVSLAAGVPYAILR